MPLHFLVHSILKRFLTTGDLAIDATAGNGHDCLFLKKQIGSSGKLFFFDIQKEALISALIKLNEHNCHNYKAIYSSHEFLQRYVKKDNAKVIVFNLGYLPGSNHKTITTKKSTLKALSHSLCLLKENGVLNITCYKQHFGGAEETRAVLQWVKYLSPKDYICKIYAQKQKENHDIISLFICPHNSSNQQKLNSLTSKEKEYFISISNELRDTF